MKYSYFQKNYDKVSFPIQDNEREGLRNSQLGAIHSIASYFTIHEKEAAIVVMPTGTGKTAVLFLSSFVLRAIRVLVITPSKLVRSQIAEGYESLEVLIQNNVLPEEIKKPKILEVTYKLDSQDKWDKLTSYDVVVSTPNSLPINNWHVDPAIDLFDLILIDEAHHSPATAWSSIFSHFINAKKILLTATPFRRDKKEIKGNFIYNYPISRAYDDKVFGEVSFIAVTENPKISSDIAIAKTAETTLRSDQESGLEHFVLVRTDTKKHALELDKIYKENTNLKLKRIDSTFTSKQIKNIIGELRKKTLDGVICVDMLGEGFDFPNLKIGVVHKPHKSLAITLQFIGRFARTNVKNIGSAKFIAIPNEINFLKLELYKEGAVWKDIIREISESTIRNEIEVRSLLKGFVSQEVEFEDDRDISLYSLKPLYHVKIFEVPKSIDISLPIVIPNNNVDVHYVNEEMSVALFITKEILKPRWLTTDELANVNFNLIIVYYDEENQLLYINSTRKTTDTYYQIANQYLKEEPKQLPLALVHRVIAELEEPEVFNLGLRSKNTINRAESYLIKAGSHVQNAVKPNELNLYEGGHLFLRGKEKGEFNTVGYSSSSKVWSSTAANVIDFIKWCSKLSKKIVSTKDVKTNTILDKISVRQVIFELPLNPIFATWDSVCYLSSPRFHFIDGDGRTYEGLLTDLEIKIDNAVSDGKRISFIVGNELFGVNYEFTLEDFFQLTYDNTEEPNVVDEEGEVIKLSVFLNENPLTFYFEDFASLRLNEFGGRLLDEANSLNLEKVEVIDWSDTDIDCEYSGNNLGKYHIHDRIKRYILAKSPNILLYDHGSGEIADFILIKELSDLIVIEFYHCKGALNKSPGNRVEDVYEVCGQAIKSGIWTHKRTLYNKIIARTSRINPSTYIVGNPTEMDRIFKVQKQIQYRILIVQPGISKASIKGNISSILAAAESYVENGDAVKYGLISS